MENRIKISLLQDVLGILMLLLLFVSSGIVSIQAEEK